jgi:small neutral amino acid transporter SnatA (MarC family)
MQGLIGPGSIIVTGLAGFYGLPWWVVAASAIVATFWYVMWSDGAIYEDARNEGPPALVRHFGFIVLVLGAAWLIGYGLTKLF